MRSRFVVVVLALVALAAFGAGSAYGQQGGQVLETDLAPLNDSGADGTATVRIEENGRVSVQIQADNVSAGLPHAQHIHIGGRNECPDENVDENGDGIISTAEGQPAYGEVQVSLTTEGDTSAESALAVERFPVASDNGALDYERTFDLPDGVTASDVRDGVIVVHGIADLSGDPNQYDGEARSSLSDNLPLEATVPTACGALTASGGSAQGGNQDGATQDGSGQGGTMPEGGVDAGFGGTAGDAGSAAPIALTLGAFALITGLALRHKHARSRA